MLVVHAQWLVSGEGELLLWAEDGEMLAAARYPGGRRASRARPRVPHPFAAPVERVASLVAGIGAGASGATPDKKTGASGEKIGHEAVVWLPGTQWAPEGSPELLRAGVDPGQGPVPGISGRRAGLWPFSVPVARLSPSRAVDALLLLAESQPADDALLPLASGSPTVLPGASVHVMAALAGLALEIVGAGRVIPGLLSGEQGRYTARWAPIGGGHDEARLGLLAASLPPVVRALSPRNDRPALPTEVFTGEDPFELARHALDAFVDAVCRDALRTPGVPTEPVTQIGAGAEAGTEAVTETGAGPAAGPRPGLTPGLTPEPGCRTGQASGSAPQGAPLGGNDSAVEAWLAALAGPSGDVDDVGGELAKLEQLIVDWRCAVAARGGPWRLCFRLREPEEADEEDEEDNGERQAGPESGTGVAVTLDEDAEWRVELLLQATDEPSLVVDAGEVWRSGDALQRATRALEAPQEVLLAELGRARGAYPELSLALREAAPTALQVDLPGAYRFLAEVAPALEVAGFGVLLPAWWRRPSSRLGARLRARSTPQGSGGAGLLGADGLQAFDWQAALGEEGMSISELQALAALKVPLVRVRGRWVELRPGEAGKLAEFLRARRDERDRGQNTLTVADVMRAAAGVDEMVAGVPMLGVEADGLVGALLRGELEDHLEVEGTPKGFEGELRPYQQRAVSWMDLLERTGLGACLADDMGLGKTAMVLALLVAERGRSGPEQGDKRDKRARESGPTLVVCPTSVVGNWKREAERFVPELKVAVHHGTGRSRTGDFSKQVADADIVITSYSLVDRDRATLALVPWSRVVLDEAQNVKNPEAKQTRAVRTLKASRRIALTGTPVENHLGELWSIMEILNPGLLGSAKAFRERFALPIERYHEEDAARGLRALTRPFVLRRLKTDRSIITDLPEKLEMKVLCNLTREQATLYKAVVDDMLRRIDEAEGIERRGLVLATMLRLKQVCNHPAQYLADSSALGGRSGKLERTVEILDEVLQGKERVLVFTQFAEMGTMLRAHLQQRLGCQVAFLHGGVDRKRRDAMVDRFQGQEDGELPVLVLSLKAGGTGLNLTRANHVVHFDRWWNPAVEDQATDRAFRIGQHRNVQVRKLICAGTLEDRIDQMIEAKRDLAGRIVGTGEDWLTELSTHELAEVFRLSSEALGAA